MAYFGISASPLGLRPAHGTRDVADGLGRHLARPAPGAPVVILVHGYRYDPALRAQNPHRLLYAVRAPRECARVRSWTLGLGFSRSGSEEGLCIGYGWPAHQPNIESLLRTRRIGFAHVYERAAEYGRRLAELIALIHRLAPSRAVDIVGHSLGARVALSALPHLTRAPGRIILLGAAEYERKAAEYVMAAPAAAPPEIYNFTARFNDLYDAVFEAFAPGRQPGDRAIGMGLRARLPHWLDIQLDRADVTEWVNERGVDMIPHTPKLCHWSFYTRDGAFSVYEAILRRKPGWDIANLKKVTGLGEQDPRWTRLRPARTRPVASDLVHDLRSA